MGKTHVGVGWCRWRCDSGFVQWATPGSIVTWSLPDLEDGNAPNLDCCPLVARLGNAFTNVFGYMALQRSLERNINDQARLEFARPQPSRIPVHPGLARPRGGRLNNDRAP